MPADIPGFVWDQERRRYFRVLKTGAVGISARGSQQDMSTVHNPSLHGSDPQMSRSFDGSMGPNSMAQYTKAAIGARKRATERSRVLRAAQTASLDLSRSLSRHDAAPGWIGDDDAISGVGHLSSLTEAHRIAAQRLDRGRVAASMGLQPLRVQSSNIAHGQSSGPRDPIGSGDRAHSRNVSSETTQGSLNSPVDRMCGLYDIRGTLLGVSQQGRVAAISSGYVQEPALISDSTDMGALLQLSASASCGDTLALTAQQPDGSTRCAAVDVFSGNLVTTYTLPEPALCVATDGKPNLTVGTAKGIYVGANLIATSSDVIALDDVHVHSGNPGYPGGTLAACGNSRLAGCRDGSILAIDTRMNSAPVAIRHLVPGVIHVRSTSGGILVASVGDKMALWDIRNAKRPVKIYPGYQNWASMHSGLALDPTRRMVAAATDSGTVRIWDVASGKILPSPVNDPVSEDEALASLAWSRNGLFYSHQAVVYRCRDPAGPPPVERSMRPAMETLNSVLAA